MRKTTLLLSFLFLLTACGGGKSEMDRFIDDLMSRMTLRQKIGQLNLPAFRGNTVTGPEANENAADLLREGMVGGVYNLESSKKIYELQKFAVDSSELHIPLLVGLDVIHGFCTQFPMPVAMSCSWEPDLAEKACRVSAAEATASGINWTFNPMVDVCHDPRWGRIAEGNGEDPFLGSEFARAYVRGYQGDLSGKPDQMLACVKHYALYGAPDGGLDYTTVDMSHARMFNCYMAPYQAAVEAGVASVMSCFNEVDGVPGAGNKWLLTDILREKWGFKGLVVSDYDGIGELCKHGLGAPEEVTVKALNAGLDMDMFSQYFIGYLEKAVADKKIREKDVDVACRRILEAKYKLGLFEDPYRFCRPEDEKNLVNCEAHHALARKIAGESMVLLRNERSVLPLTKSTRVLLTGPYSDEAINVMGGWHADGPKSNPVSLLAGLNNAGAKLVYAHGSNVCLDKVMQERMCGDAARHMLMKWDDRNPKVIIAEAVAKARNADVIVAAVGEPAHSSSEAACRTDIRIPDAQRDLIESLKATGKPLVLVVFAGRPLDLSRESEIADAILYAWFPGSEAGNAIADVIYGDVNPSGRLTVSFPRCVGQLPYFYNHTQSGRPYKGKYTKYCSTYIDCEPTPLYPFGYGLSYSRVKYENLNASVVDGVVNVSVEVTNISERYTKEVVQLYTRDIAASIARPVCELKGYRKVYLGPGECATINFELDKKALSFYNNDLEFFFEPGEFAILCGPDCEHCQSVTVTL